MKKVSPLQKVLDDAVAQVPRRIAVSILQRKLDALDIRKPGLVEALADHILSRSEEDFSFDDGEEGPPKKLALEFGDADNAELAAQFAEFERSLPELIEGLVSSAAKNLVRTYKRTWPDHRNLEQRELSGFQHGIDRRWGKAIDLLQMLITISREIGADEHARFLRSRSKRDRTKRGVLLQLHARACQISNEVVVLLSAGYADGAFARWRTLHEIATVAQLISDFGDELAQRYLDHEAIECSRGARVYADVYQSLGFRPIPAREIRRIDRAVQSAIAKHGSDFRNEYGWASEALKNKNPKFIDLERAAGRSPMRSHYKMASQNVHAGVMGIARKLGSLDREPRLIAGPSNAGIEEPGQNTAITLLQITATILHRAWSLDDTALLLSVANVRDLAVASFAAAGRKLARDART